MVESMNIDHLKDLKENKIISEAYYVRSVLDFAKIFVEKNMKLQILDVVEREEYGGMFVTREPGAVANLAVKIVIKDKCSSQETDIWSSLKHPHILRLLDKQYVPRMDAYIFVTEHYPYTLDTYLQNNDFRRDGNALFKIMRILQGVLEGLGYLHERQYSYLNIKPKNVFISRGNVTVIKGFNLLQSVSEVPQGTLISRRYGPPEMYFENHPKTILRGDYHDIWSFGILALSVFTNFYIQRKLTEGANWEDRIYPVLYKILERKRFRKHLKQAFPSCKIRRQDRWTNLNLVIMCLRIAPIERPSANMLLRHKYFMPEGGFLGADKGPWKKKIKVATAGWIDIINPKFPGSLISDVNDVEESKKKSSESDSDDSDDEENEYSKHTLKEQDSKTSLTSSRSERNSAQLSRAGPSSGSNASEYSNCSQIRKQREKKGKTKKMCCKATTLNFPEATVSEDKITHKDTVSNAVDGGKFEAKSSLYDDFSAEEVVKFLQPTVFGVEGLNSKFSKWLTYKSPGKQEPPPADKSLPGSESNPYLSSKTEKVVGSTKNVRNEGFGNCPHTTPIHERTRLHDQTYDEKLLHEASMLERNWYPRCSDEALHAVRYSKCVLHKRTDFSSYDKKTPNVKSSELNTNSERITTNDSNNASKHFAKGRASRLTNVLVDPSSSLQRIQSLPSSVTEIRKLFAVTGEKIKKTLNKKPSKDIKNASKNAKRSLTLNN